MNVCANITRVLTKLFFPKIPFSHYSNSNFSKSENGTAATHSLNNDNILVTKSR